MFYKLLLIHKKIIKRSTSTASVKEQVANDPIIGFFRYVITVVLPHPNCAIAG